jgi:hypothetical protein
MNSPNRLRDVVIGLAVAAVAVLLGVGIAVVVILSGNVSHLQGQVSQLQGQVTTLQGQGQQLQEQVTRDHGTLAKIPPQAGTGQLGICYETSTQSFTNLYDSVMDGYPFVISVNAQPPNLINGVVSCPSGFQFVPVTPVRSSTTGN